jgi:hypothetical protein
MDMPPYLREIISSMFFLLAFFWLFFTASVCLGRKWTWQYIDDKDPFSRALSRVLEVAAVAGMAIYALILAWQIWVLL